MPIIALLDTNIWVSAFINPNGYPSRLKNAWIEQRFQVVISDVLVREIADVLSRPRIRDKYGIVSNEVTTLIRLLQMKAVKVSPTGTLHICRDPDDDAILETAILGNAEYVVSRDEDITRDTDLRVRLIEQGIMPISVNHFSDLIEPGKTSQQK